MEIMIVKKPLKTTTRYFVPGSVYLMYFNWRYEITDLLKSKGIKHAVTFHNLDQLISRYKVNDTRLVTDVLIYWTGGIGDVIALTAIMNLNPYITYHLVCQKHYREVGAYMPFKIRFLEPTDPFITMEILRYKAGVLNNWRYYSSQGTVEAGDNRNWYDVFFGIIGAEKQGDEMKRPHLINNSHYDIMLYKGKSLLIINKASCMIRTTPLIDIIQSLPDTAIDKYNIYAYKNKGEDYIAGVNYLEPGDFKSFLHVMATADQVITVDTCALHFREGLKKPAIGLFNAFTAECRTKYYQYTKSFDIKSECPLQPCYQHDSLSLHHCQMGKAEDFAPPCFRSENNPELKMQLRTIFAHNL